MGDAWGGELLAAADTSSTDDNKWTTQLHGVDKYYSWLETESSNALRKGLFLVGAINTDKYTHRLAHHVKGMDAISRFRTSQPLTIP